MSQFNIEEFQKALDTFAWYLCESPIVIFDDIYGEFPFPNIHCIGRIRYEIFKLGDEILGVTFRLRRGVYNAQVLIPYYIILKYWENEHIPQYHAIRLANTVWQMEERGHK